MVRTTRWRWLIGTALLALWACGPKNDCQRLAELTCKTEGTSPEDCRSARRAAKEAKTEAEFAACGRILRSFQPGGESSR
ncbi:hypothetical protein KBD49_09165 [Myxococcota bacterium]|jgi:hypothetical protein|nr:hypothetical protein [Myxococcota bacterium]